VGEPTLSLIGLIVTSAKSADLKSVLFQYDMPRRVTGLPNFAGSSIFNYLRACPKGLSVVTVTVY